jgi:hypothetical protein
MHHASSPLPAWSKRRDTGFPNRYRTRYFFKNFTTNEDSFIHLVVCLTTGPKPLPKRALHIVRSRASFFKWEYPLVSLRSSNSFLRLLPCLPVTSIQPCIFPSITRCRRQFLRKIWPILEGYYKEIWSGLASLCKKCERKDCIPV